MNRSYSGIKTGGSPRSSGATSHRRAAATSPCNINLSPGRLRRERSFNVEERMHTRGKNNFPGNIEGALPEGPASNGSRPTDRLILHGVVRDPVSKLSIRPFEIKRETPEAILASWILTILGRRRPPPRTMTFGPPGQPNNLIRSNRLCRGGKAVGLPSVLPVRVQGLTGIPGGAPADRRGDP